MSISDNLKTYNKTKAAVKILIKATADWSRHGKGFPVFTNVNNKHSNVLA